ncbi:MAG: C1 family peptidase [Bdellovibrio sp.]|nr:C1 family peptidase [Bdellovibrio sp.]
MHMLGKSMKNVVIIITLFLIPSMVWAKTVSAKNEVTADFGPNTMAVLGALESETGIVHTPDTPSVKPDDTAVKPDSKPEPTPEPEPTPTPAPTPKKLSAGEQKIQEMLKKNREKVAEDQGLKLNDGEGGADLVAKAREKTKTDAKNAPAENSSDDNKEAARPGESLRDQYLRNLSNLKRKNQETLKSMRAQVQDTYARWKEKQQEFLKNLETYKENTIPVQSFGSSAPQGSFAKKSKKISLSSANVNTSDVWLIPRAFEVPVRDQAKRPTCAAFAGVRAHELLLAQNGIDVDLSEQYFYWVSKPNCASRPCSDKGSWVLEALEQTHTKGKSIPKEQDCPYVDTSLPGNETQIPMSNSCTGRGVAQAKEYYPLNSQAEIKSTLEQNIPVMAGFTLTPNFYTTKGLVTLADSNLAGATDSHAAGHALIIVGHMKLGEKYKSEGSLCYIVSNSWSEGWGAGGHACLTEAWVKKNLIPRALMALRSLDISN